MDDNLDTAVPDTDLPSESSAAAIPFDHGGDQSVLRMMMDATPLCVTLFDSRSNCIDCNQEALRLFEVGTREEYTERFFRFSPEFQPDGSSSAEEAFRYLAKALREGSCAFRWTHLTSTGCVLPTEITLVRLSTPGEDVVAGYARDLRPQLAAEQLERSASERVKLLLGASPLFVSLWNRDYQNIECNQEALNLFDIDDKGTYLDHFFDLSPERQPDGTLTSDKVRQVIDEAFARGRYVFEWMHCTPDGEPIPSEVTLVRLQYQGDYVVAGYTRDMRSQLEAERSARESAKRLDALVRSLPLGCMFWTDVGELLECNEQAAKMFRLPDEAAVREHYYTDLFPPKQPDGRSSVEKIREMVKEALESGHSVSEWMYHTIDGEPIPSELTLVPISDGSDGYQIASYCRDLRELQSTLEINRKLQQLAYFDPLTGASSRINFMQMLKARMADLREGDTFGLGLFDVDHFKEVNDAHGHKAGDLVLEAIVSRVRDLLPEGGIVGRYGGDEFMVQLGVMGRHELEQWYARLLREVSRIKVTADSEILGTAISLGCCFWQPACHDAEVLLEQADAALYEAKNAGRNCYVMRDFIC
ncbi:MAG: diguanylate cyclase [Gordonibacter sp.]|uniref:sensor domain-containing diguanylate cyclase n=1 Tax=Gordonibacter sp. TaxID=1968902 RepID=UPI002FCAD5ED